MTCLPMQVVLSPYCSMDWLPSGEFYEVLQLGNVGVEPNHHVEGNVDVEPNHHVEGKVDVEPNHHVEGNVAVEPNHHVEGKVGELEGKVQVEPNHHVEGNVEVEQQCHVEGHVEGNVDVEPKKIPPLPSGQHGIAKHMRSKQPKKETITEKTYIYIYT